MHKIFSYLFFCIFSIINFFDIDSDWKIILIKIKGNFFLKQNLYISKQRLLLKKVVLLLLIRYN